MIDGVNGSTFAPGLAIIVMDTFVAVCATIVHLELRDLTWGHCYPTFINFSFRRKCKMIILEFGINNISDIDYFQF